MHERALMVRSLIEDNKKALEVIKNLPASDRDDSFLEQIRTIDKNIDFTMLKQIK